MPCKGKELKRGVKLFAFSMTSNVLGMINPVRELTDLAHKHGALVVVDGAQAAAHMPVDVQALDVDFFAFSGHKVYGPTSIGALYGKKKLLDVLPPFLFGGEMISEVHVDRTSFNEVPYKFEAGTPNITGAIGLGAAIDYLEALNWDAVHQHEAELLDYATQKVLDEMDGVRIIGTAQNKASVLSFVIDDIHAHDLGTVVDQMGVAIRTGHHCAMPVMDFFGVPATARASFAFYNTREDIDQLVLGLRKARELFG